MKEKDKQPVYIAPSIEQYQQMTPAEKRICIAKDVIAMLNAEIYVATSGHYIRSFKVNDEYISNDKWDKWSDKWKDKDIQQMLPEMKECEVCALGSCILSITKYENKLKLSDVGISARNFTDTTDNLIKEVFSPRQFLIIETMFEGAGIDSYVRERLVYDEEDYYDIKEKCEHWYNDYNGSTTERMKKIFEILVEHGGEINVDRI